MVRRSLVHRPENELSLALAEIERLKGITSRVTDGRQIVFIPGGNVGAAPGGGVGDGGDGGLPPVATARHVLFGSKHTNSFLVTAAEGVSLTIFIQAGQVWAGGTFRDLAATTLQMADATTNYVYISAAGAIASNVVSFPSDSAPLATVVTAGGDITSVNDRRSYLSTGGAVVGSLHDADQIIDDDGDTSVEVERNADEDIIRFKAEAVDVALIASAGQWQLPITGSGAGLLVGGDCLWYRASANVWRTPDFVNIDQELRVAGAAFLGSNDAVSGLLHVYGHAAASSQGGRLQMYLAADHDGTFEYWGVDVNSDDLRFFTSDAVITNTMTPEGQLKLPGQGSGAGLLMGGDALLYRESADRLATPDELLVVDTLHLSAVEAAGVGASVDNQQLLIFGTDRAWAFEVNNEGGGTQLVLRSLNADKVFVVEALDGTGIFKVRAHSAGRGEVTVFGTLFVDDILERTSGAGVDIEGIRVRDGRVWGEIPSPSLGISNHSTISLSGNEITDRIRAVNTEGDGRLAPDSSFGVWAAATNLVTNGGFETNNTGWVNEGGTNSRITSEFKFGAASGQIVTDNAAANEGAYHAFAGAAATEYTCSAWVRGALGGTVRIALSDDVSGKQASATATLTPVWQRIEVTATTGGGSVTFRVYVETNVQQDMTFEIDGVQVEANDIATPYVETDGGTASRSASAINIPSTVVDETQGWCAFRVRAGVDGGDLPTSAALFNWRNGTPLIILTYEGGSWSLQSRAVAGLDSVSTSLAISAADSYTVVAAWDEDTIYLSVNGAAFATAARADGVPDLSGDTTVDIGSRLSANEMHSDLLWVMLGTGTLSDVDAALLNAVGDTLPKPGFLLESAAPSFVWDANTADEGSDVLLQDPDLITFDYANLRMGLFGVTPIVRASAYTQTFATADKTHAVDGSAAMPAGGVGTAAGGWDTAVNRDQAIAEFAALRATVDDLKQLVNSIIDDLQAYGFFQ